VRKTKGWGQKKIKSKGRKLVRKNLDEEVQNREGRRIESVSVIDLIPIIGGKKRYWFCDELVDRSLFFGTQQYSRPISIHVQHAYAYLPV
jgi:hypothetical protein